MLQMAKDDFDVIVFKILSYLYSCLKNGARVDVCNLREVLKVNIPDSYWEYIIRELCYSGYVEGVILFKNIFVLDDRINIQDNFKIKPEGIYFLSENSRMDKAKKFLQDARECLFWVQ